MSASFLERAGGAVPALFLAGMILVVAGCSTRDHDNPLDPENPSTGGEPRWLEALAGDGLVDLSWAVRNYEDLEQIQVIESGSGDPIWVGKRTEHTFTHTGLANGTDFRYHLDLKLSSGTTLTLPDEVATPGRSLPWILDFGSGYVVRMTPDGRGARVRTLDPSAVAVEADPATGEVLVVDFFGGSVRLLDTDAEEVWSSNKVFRPNAALRTAEGWWVTDSGLGSTLLFDTEGEVVFEETSLTFPVAMAPAGAGHVWVADRLGPLVKMNADSGIVVADTLASPYTLCEAPDGGVWVADRDADVLIRLDGAGEELVRLGGFPGIEALAADPVNGGVWVAERSRRQILFLGPDGSELLAVPGFPSPSSLAVSPDGEEVWVVDPVLGRLVRISRSGDTLVESRGLASPTSVSVAFDPAP